MVEAIACFFLISFPLAAWLAYSVAKRVYRPRPGDTSFLAKILSSNGQSFSSRLEQEAMGKTSNVERPTFNVQPVQTDLSAAETARPKVAPEAERSTLSVGR